MTHALKCLGFGASMGVLVDMAYECRILADFVAQRQFGEIRCLDRPQGPPCGYTRLHRSGPVLRLV